MEHDDHQSRLGGMSPTWVWTQVAIIVCVVAGIVVGIVKLA